MKLRSRHTSLPDSILLEIFNYLSYAEICQVSRVCKTWRRVAQDSSLRRKIDIRSTSLRRTKMKQFLRSQCTKVLQKLNIKGGGVFFEPDLQNQAVQFTPSCFKELQKRAPNLKYLSIEKAVIVKDMNVRKVKKFHIPACIRHLSLRGSFIHPSTSIQFSQEITCLDLGNTTIDCSSERLLKLAHINSLKALYLDCCNNFTDNYVFMLMQLLTRLKVIDLEHTKITDSSVSVILRRCHQLTHLYLGHNQITYQPFMNVEKSRMPDLKELCLLETQIDIEKEELFRSQLPSTTVFSVSKCIAPKEYCDHYKNHSCEMIK